MTDEALKKHNNSKLLELHPWLMFKVSAVLQDLSQHKFRPRIQCAWRSPSDQLDAYNNGYSKLKFGFHNVTHNKRPCSLAADIVDDNNPYNESREFLLKLYSSAKAHGLETGILFGLSTTRRNNLNEAVSNKNWKFTGPIGWDPWHVQPTSKTITVAQAKAGQQPS